MSSESKHVTGSKEGFTKTLHRLGVSQGDVLMVHSSLRSLGNFEGGGEAVLDALGEAVGEGGLLAVPTHTWDVVNDGQPVWHETLTPSHVGMLTNLARRRTDAVRSIHPSHSVAALGGRALEFCEGHERDTSPCSPTSPYARLREWNGKILLIGVSLNRCTYFHCLEEIAGLGELWSLGKPSARFCIRSNGDVIRVMMRTHDRCVSNHFDCARTDLIEAGAVVQGVYGHAMLLLVDAAATADFLLPRFQENPKYFW